MAKIYSKSGEKLLILSIRQGMIEPFVAPGWVDLRVGFFLSLTQAAADDTITGLSETLDDGSTSGLVPLKSRYWIGVKVRDTFFPGSIGTTFIGFTNTHGFNNGGGLATEDFGTSVLASSDEAIGTSNTNFWRPSNGNYADSLGGMFENSFPRIAGSDGIQQHFPQNTAGAGGYAVLHALRLTRPNSSSAIITAQIKSSVTHSGDMLFTNTPTSDLLISTMQAWPTTVQQWGPAQLSRVPDALYLYWPFRNSRLRVHAMGVLKAK